MRPGRSLAERFPVLAAQWHPTKNGSEDIRTLSQGSKKKVWWLGDCGHEWEAVVRNRVRGSGCPYCSGRQVLAGYNDLATTHPSLAGELAADKNGAELSADSVSAGSNKRVWWRCSEDHTWQATINNRSTNGTGCPTCAGRTVVAGRNDVATKNPALALLWHPTKNDRSPSETHHSSHDKTIWWMCPKGHEWQNSPNAMSTRATTGCAVCASKEVIAGVNDFAHSYPDLAEQWHPTKNGDLLPTQVTSKSNKKVWWVCSEGHEWVASVKQQTVSKSPCPVCSHRVVQRGFNDLGTLYPSLAAEWNAEMNPGLSSSVLPTSDKRVWWVCEEGHTWQAAVNSRVKQKSGCPVCRYYAAPGQDLETLFPGVAAEFHPTKNEGWRPDVLSYGSDREMWWVCPKGHEWKTTVKNRTVAMSKCPHCYATSFVSSAEKEIGELLRSWGLEVRTSVRDVLPKKELDIYLPQERFAIEFNGLYWHSERHKERDYHLNKSLACDEQGIYLYQVWEDDWRLRKAVVVRGIAHRLGLTSRISELFGLDAAYSQRAYARKLRAVVLDAQSAEPFLEENHIQGFVTGSGYYGLVDGAGQVQAILVVKRRSSGSGTWSIERYATRGTVIGGFTKLLSFAERQNPDVIEWVTFSDNTVSDGKLYENTGFAKDKVLPPDYSYLVGGERKHKFLYRTARFKSDPGLLWEEGLTERELAEMNGLYRVWDSGKIRWKKTV